MNALFTSAVLLISTLGVPGMRESASDGLRGSFVEGHAQFAHGLYAECEERAEELAAALRSFVALPSEETHLAAKRAWLAGRAVYGKTEVLRFSGGPIDNARDGVETLLNAWPLDESYIDGVRGNPGAGIIQNPDRYPSLSGTLLDLLNERGGEANVAVGWHAVEFLLWGQDFDPKGPGARTFRDYLPDHAPFAERRALYLVTCGDLLVLHHSQLTQAWAAEADNYRAAWVAGSEDAAVRGALTGMLVLSGFEMAGERLAVAYETQDQEEEHSCFSDNTHTDFIANQLGIVAVYRGEAGGGAGPGLRAIAHRFLPELADRIDGQLGATLAALRAMPVPFDQAVLGKDEAPGRKAVLAALVALEEQTASLSTLALSLGFEIAIQPGG